MSAPRTPAVSPDQFTTFGALLRFLRRRAGLTQRELSIAVGYSESQISRLEQNVRAPDPAALAARFVPALELDTEPLWVARLMELAGENRTTSAAAPTPSVTPNNLPLQLTSFIGRKNELAEIHDWLTGQTPARLVTLTGHGGCGKTRLAQQAAADLLDAYPDGVWFVELAPVGEASHLPRAVAAVLGLPKESGRAGIDLLAAHLRNSKTLLVLDNCEHLIDGAAYLIETLLRRCPNIAVLATSREMLGAAGEHPMYVRSLATPEPDTLRDTETLLQYGAVRLFIERAAVLVPDFALTSANAEVVIHICQRLDGIPLALELAAARLRVLPLDQIAARLDNAFRLLTGGRRTALPRHQTLQALIDWSHDLLTEPERILFRRLAVFTGGWTLEAVESICAGDGIDTRDILETLSHLIDKSLVFVVRDRAQDTTRYRLLEIIRQYAQTKLAASGEAGILRQRYAHYYFGLAEAGAPLGPSERTHSGWLDRMETEHDNLRAALAWSLAEVDNPALEARQAQGSEIWMSAWALNRIGWLARERGEMTTARNRLEASLAVYRELADPPGIARTAITLGEVYVMQNEPALANAILVEGLQLARQQNETDAIGWALNHLGHAAQIQSDYERAQELHTESLAVFESSAMQEGISWANLSLGDIALVRGDTAHAREHFRVTLEIARGMRDAIRLAWGLNGLAGVATLENDAERAAWFWGAADSILRAEKTRPAPASDRSRGHLMVQARTRLGEAAFNTAYKSGQAASLEQSVARMVEFYNLDHRTQN